MSWIKHNAIGLITAILLAVGATLGVAVAAGALGARVTKLEETQSSVVERWHRFDRALARLEEAVRHIERACTP